MAKCHNCGLETLRTEDWACQWCGHPLLHGPFKKIEKTYKQLKEERLYEHRKEAGIINEPEIEIKPEKEPEPKQDLELIKGLNLELETEPEKKAEIIQKIETEPKEKIEELEKEPVVELETKPIQEAEARIEIEPEEEAKTEPEAVEEHEAEEIQENEPKTELIKETEPEEIEKTEPETEIIPEPEPEIEPADIELTAGEILTAYETDDVAADERFVNKILRVTGTVSMIDIKDKLDTHYIRLTGNSGDPWQSVQCMFDKKHTAALGQLEKGQTITAQGRYNGSIIAIRMVKCVLVP